MGVFITVEGGEFVGKTSVIVPGLKRVLEANGVPVLVSREPGGTPKGEEIRKTIFQRLEEHAPAIELAQLFNIARKIHLDEIVLPFLSATSNKRGVVILDRYLDSTRVYQGMEGGVSQHELSSLEKRYVKGVYPDLTLIAYIPEDIFESTMKLRSIPSKSDHLRSKTLWDKSDIIAHLQRQKYYLQLPELFRKQKIRRKFALLDASLTPADVIIESINLCALVFARKNICSVRSLMSTATALTKKNRSEVLYGLIKGRTNSKKSRKIDL